MTLQYSVSCQALVFLDILKQRECNLTKALFSSVSCHLLLCALCSASSLSKDLTPFTIQSVLQSITSSYFRTVPLQVHSTLESAPTYLLEETPFNSGGLLIFASFNFLFLFLLLPLCSYWFTIHWHESTWNYMSSKHVPPSPPPHIISGSYILASCIYKINIILVYIFVC